LRVEIITIQTISIMKKYFFISTLLFLLMSCSSPREKVSDFCFYVMEGDYENASKCTKNIEANSIKEDYIEMYRAKDGLVSYNIIDEEISDDNKSAEVEVLYITGDGLSFNVFFYLTKDFDWKITSYEGNYTFYDYDSFWD